MKSHVLCAHLSHMHGDGISLCTYLKTKNYGKHLHSWARYHVKHRLFHDSIILEMTTVAGSNTLALAASLWNEIGGRASSLIQNYIFYCDWFDILLYFSSFIFFGGDVSFRHTD